MYAPNRIRPSIEVLRAATMSFDLILRGSRVIDLPQELDAVTDIAFAGGEVVMVGSKLKADSGTDVHDASGYIVTPGLIDLHTDVYWVATSTLPVAEASRNAELTCIT